mgnify:CR=1 FL=1
MSTKKIRIILVVMVLVLILGYLAFLGFRESAAYYYSLEEVSPWEGAPKKMRIKGELVQESISYHPEQPLLTFSLAEEEHRLPVFYYGVMPDNFSHADEVIVEGKFEESGQFTVSKLMLQCPSKYEDGE